MARVKPFHHTLEHQFALGAQALSEARNHLKAGWYASAIGHAFQVAHRAAAGLLYGLGARIETEKDVRYGFSAQFVVPGRVSGDLLRDYDELVALRNKAEFDYEYVADLETAQRALALAERFWEAAGRLRTQIS